MCCQAEDEHSEGSASSSDESSPASAATCFYQIFCVANSNEICQTSNVLPYGERVLPSFGIDHSLDSFRFDVSRPMRGSSNLCFLPYVEQVFKKGQGKADVPVSCWAQLSPCGGLHHSTSFGVHILTTSCAEWAQTPGQMQKLLPYHITPRQSLVMSELTAP